MDKQGNSTNENAYRPASEGIDNVHEQLRTPLQYRLLFKERKRRAKIADAYVKRAGRHAVLAAVNGDDGALRVWSHAQSIYARARNSLRARGGIPQPGAPR